MPRKHKYVERVPYEPVKGEEGKTRYPSQKAAEDAAEIRMLQVPNLELAVYKGLDGGWYLTSQTEPKY